jgi:hypothetical protein
MNRLQAERFVNLFFRRNLWLGKNPAPFDLGCLASPQFTIDEILIDPARDEVHEAAKEFGRQLLEDYKFRKLSSK